MPPAPPKTLLVTGANGYIGKHVIHAALQAGYRVRGSLRDLSKSDEVRNAVGPSPKLTFVQLGLMSPDGWDTALAGVDALVHVASPQGTNPFTDPDAFLKPALSGTRIALEAAARAGVKRVIVTSSLAAMIKADLSDGKTYGPDDWTDPTLPGVSPYYKSKVLAEKLAFELADKHGLDLTTILPGFVWGAPLDDLVPSTVDIIDRLLQGRDPAMPRLAFPSVHVRDVAAAHIAALSQPDSIGKRIAACDRTLWLADLARLIREVVPDAKTPRFMAPSILVRLMGLIDPVVRTTVPDLGRDVHVDGATMRDLLGRPAIPPEEAVRETALFLSGLRSG